MALPEKDAELLLLHNPRCSKSRQTHALLTERGVVFKERRYLDDPLSRRELADLAERLGQPVSGWVRTGDAAFREAGLAADAGDEALLDALAAQPALLQRPILIRGRRAALGRPPEAVLALLDPPDGSG